MSTKGTRGSWWAVGGGGLLLGLGLILLYTWLPVDGATGDLESFRADGFHVQWLLEEREGGLRVGDVIVRAGGYSVEEWLEGAPRGPEWRPGGVVRYEVIRDDQLVKLDVRLAPVPLGAILDRWAPQLVVALAFLFVGAYVFWKRPDELAARLLMVFCVLVALQYLGDAYNIQYATLPWRWPFWFHLSFEHIMYGLSVSTICYFAMVFPVVHPWVARFPRLVPSVLYASLPLAILIAMALSPTWTAALNNGNHASWLVTLALLGIAIGAGVRSFRKAPDPVTRAQIRWIVWCAIVGCVVFVPGYVLPLIMGRAPFLTHPLVMITIALIPLAFGVAILRYRLFDIEIIINRTLVYGTLTALLAGLYLLLVRLLTLLAEVVWQGERDTVVVFTATLIIALVFAPLRRRVQALIDRAFYRTKLDYQRLLPEMSERLATSILLEELSALLTKEVPQRLQIAGASVAVLDPEGEYFVQIDNQAEDSILRTDHPLLTYLERLGQPLLRLQPPPTLPNEAGVFLEEHGVELSIPLIVGGKLVGLYNLAAKQSGSAYTHDEVRLLHLLGRQAAVAVENSRLFQAEREQRRMTEALQEAAKVVNSTLDLDQVLDRILEEVEEVVVGDAYNIMLVESGIARVVRWRGYERLGVNEQISSLYLPIKEYPTLARMMQTGSPVIVSDAVTDPDWVPLAGWEWLRSCLSAPIQMAGQTVGFLNVDRTQPSRYGAADAQRLEAFAHQAATALQNARLYAETQRQLGEQTALREAGAIISSTLDLGAVLGRIAEQMGLAVGATSAYICDFDVKTKGTSVLAEYISPQANDAERISDLGARYVENDEGFLALMRAGLHDVSHIDDPDLAKEERLHMEQYRAQTILYVPLRIKGQLIGFTELWESRRRREFSPAELALCHGIAQQAAIALENARLYGQAQREITVRREVEEQIKASLEEKEVLLKEIHHRVKNNLQVISSLLYLQSKKIHDKNTLEMFLESQHRVRSMALVHERLYRTGDLARVDCAEYVRDLVRYLHLSYGPQVGPVKLDVKVDDIFLGIDTAVPCGLIISELVSNSFKHAFPSGRAGEILVGLAMKRDGSCSLTVQDNGVGIPAGWDLEDPESLGLRLVSRLVEQIEGVIELDRNGGTTFNIVFTAPGSRMDE